MVNNKKQITSSGKLTPTGTVLEHRWVSIPEGAGPEKAFEARGVYSYSVKEKTIIKQYQSSTGVHMTGRLVAVQDKKMLWERTGEGQLARFESYVSSTSLSQMPSNTSSYTVH